MEMQNAKCKVVFSIVKVMCNNMYGCKIAYTNDLHITIKAVNSSHCAYTTMDSWNLCIHLWRKNNNNNNNETIWESEIHCIGIIIHTFIHKYTGRKCSIGRSVGRVVVIIIVVVNKCVYCKNKNKYTFSTHLSVCACVCVFSNRFGFFFVIVVLFFGFSLFT